MFCGHCNTPFKVLPIEEGKSKFCENCGELIYKMENGNIIFNEQEAVLAKQDEELELRERINREKETRFKEQLERKEKEKEFRERLEQERLILEKEEQERKQKEKDEQDRLFQLQLEEERRLKERLLQIQQEKDRMELERYENEMTEREQKIREQIIKEEEEKVKKAIAEKELLFQSKLEIEQKERERLENEIALYEKQRKALEEKFALEKKHFELAQKVRAAQEQERLSFIERERKIKENLLLAQLDNERLERERLERERDLAKNNETKAEPLKVIDIPVEEVAEIEIKDSDAEIPAIINEPVFETQNIVENTSSNEKSVGWIITAFIIAGLLLSIYVFRNKLPFFNTATKTVIAKNNASILDAAVLNSDTALIQRLKSDITGKEILSWNAIKQDEVSAISILSGTQNGEKKDYTISLNLDDKTGTKAKAEAVLQYDKNILSNIETTKITYTNIAPVRAWFSFTPVSNCSVSVNTNNNPIQLKTCDNCAVQKMVSDINKPVTIENAAKIFIKSDNKYDGLVEFTYVPLK